MQLSSVTFLNKIYELFKFKWNNALIPISNFWFAGILVLVYMIIQNLTSRLVLEANQNKR